MDKRQMTNAEYHAHEGVSKSDLDLWGFRFAEDKEGEFEEILDGTSELYVREETK